MKEKYEDLIYRVVSKKYPYVKKIDFIILVDDPDLLVIVHIDTDMISPQSKDDNDPQDYLHHLFYPDGVGEETRKEVYKLDELLYEITSPLSKLLVPKSNTTFSTGSFIQYIKYEREI
jgi:hypothetical protein